MSGEAAADRRILVLNAGSTSLKASLVEEPGDRTLGRTATDWSGRADDARAALEQLLERLGADGRGLSGIGHRVVHGGERYTAPTMLGSGLLETLDELARLAPLHNPPAIAVIRAAAELLPDLPQVACFDTAFHATLPDAARIYPLPWEWYERWGIRRYGFHGLSVEWSVSRAAQLLGRPPEALNLVVAHLGGGCSVTAVAGGRSVDTSMGYTPLEGLMMATRGGSVDPGILLELLADGRLDAPGLTDALLHRSGLLAIGGSANGAEVEALADAGDERAALALEMFARRAAAGVAAAATSLPSLDALIFTAGIGEHSARLRGAIADRLGGLGIPRLDSGAANADEMLATSPQGVSVLRSEAREDLVIARATAARIGRG